MVFTDITGTVNMTVLRSIFQHNISRLYRLRKNKTVMYILRKISVTVIIRWGASTTKLLGKKLIQWVYEHAYEAK